MGPLDNIKIGTDVSLAVGNGTPAGSFTPGTPASSFGSATPYRDRLNINADEQNSDALKEQLRMRFQTLPTPQNDYEIILPDAEASEAASTSGTSVDPNWVEDAQDTRAARQRAELDEMESVWQHQSQSVQRNMPRPVDMNSSILRPEKALHTLSELQKAEELVKQEMLTMQHHDAIFNPTYSQQGFSSKLCKGKASLLPGETVVSEEKHTAYLKSHPYYEIDDAELEEARQLLDEEVGVVKSGMGHGELSIDSFSQVWDECYQQVLFVPGQSRYTRANLASKKDRIESLEYRLENYRNHMSKEAKKAAKTEKKLKLLLGGYQARGQTLIKQLQETFDDLEMSQIEKETFESLKADEESAIPSRVDSLTTDVSIQEEREENLQQQFDELTLAKEKHQEKILHDLANPESSQEEAPSVAAASEQTPASEQEDTTSPDGDIDGVEMFEDPEAQDIPAAPVDVPMASVDMEPGPTTVAGDDITPERFAPDDNDDDADGGDGEIGENTEQSET